MHKYVYLQIVKEFIRLEKISSESQVSLYQVSVPDWRVREWSPVFSGRFYILTHSIVPNVQYIGL